MVFEHSHHRFGSSSSRRRVFLAAFCLFLLASGCAKRKPRVPVAIPAPVGTAEVGIASWYGHPYHGRRAANGEIYDMEKLTAAHRTLPFETWVRVLNTVNGKTVDVRINDRGPFVKGRIIDLSRAAADAIDLIRPGVVKVRVQVIGNPAKGERELYAVQLGLFRERENAERLCEKMRRAYKNAIVVRRDGTAPAWRVLVGRESSYPDAAKLAQSIRKDHGSVFVVRLDEPAR